MADREVKVKVSAVDAASGVFDKVGAEADGMAQKVERGGINFQAAGAAMTVAGGAIVGGLVSSAKAAGDYGGMIFDATRKTGMAAQDLTALKFAAEQSGVGFDQLTGAITKQARTAVAAKDGTGPMAEAYRQLGVSVTDASGQMKDGNTLFLETAEALKGIENPSERAALAMQVFGRGGAQLLPLLMEGSSGIAALEQKARDIGLTMTDEAARMADDAGDRMEAAQASISMAWKSIGATVLPVLAEIAEKVATVVGHLSRWSQEHPTLAKGLTLVVGGVGALMAAIGPLLVVLPSLKAGLAILGIGKVATDATAAAGGLGTMLTGAKGLWTTVAGADPAIAGFGAKLASLAVAGGPILLVVAALAALGYELYKLKQSWDATKQAAEQATKAYQQGTKAEQAAANARGRGDVAAKQAQEREQAAPTIGERVWGALTPGMTSKDYARQRVWNSQASPLARRAGGGPVQAGEPYLIGENGPEVMVPDASGVVVPNSALTSSASDATLFATIMGQKAARGVPQMQPPRLETIATQRTPAVAQARGVVASRAVERTSEPVQRAASIGVNAAPMLAMGQDVAQRGADIPAATSAPRQPEQTGGGETVITLKLDPAVMVDSIRQVVASRDGRDIIVRTVKAERGTLIPASAYGGY